MNQRSWKTQPAKQNWFREKTSVGIACGRFHEGRPQLLLVCKRYTYAYSAFAHGRYSGTNNDMLIGLFNGMTIEEKLDILSLNFMQIWYRIWLNSPHRGSSFFVAKNKFETTFLVDGGVRLRRLINKSTHSEKIWEMPKGRRKNKSESDIYCAIREFYEETGLKKNTYKLYPRIKRSHTFVDDGVRYTNIYYFAFMIHNINPKIDFNLHDQLYEISDIQWMDINEIKRVDSTGRLVNFARPIMSYMKKHCK